jgi:hypothetical protein
MRGRRYEARLEVAILVTAPSLRVTCSDLPVRVVALSALRCSTVDIAAPGRLVTLSLQEALPSSLLFIRYHITDLENFNPMGGGRNNYI